MKKLFLTTAAMGMILGGAVFGLSNKNTSAVKVSAESATKDMSGVTYWNASEGNFFEFENWKTSKLGYSFEFQIKNETLGHMAFKLRSGATEVTAPIYGFHSNNGIVTTASDVGHVGVVDSENGWYRFELMLGDVAATAGTESLTVDNIFFLRNWGATYYNEMIVRDLKVITRYTDDLVAVDVTGKNGLSRWDNNFPYVTNWGSSGKGIFLEYKPIVPANRIPVKLRVRSGSSGYLSQWYLNGAAADCVGKEFVLENGWRRYEVMPEDVFAIDANKQYESWEVFAIEFQWNNPAQYGFSTLGDFGTINGYSKVVTYSDNGTSTKAYVPTGDTAPKMIPAGSSTGEFDGWYTEAACTNKYDFSSAVTTDLTLYANYVDADVVAVNAFVANYMHMNDVATTVTEDTGACKGETGYYAVAKAALAELTNGQRKLFATASEYADAYARLCAWAVANGEELVINTTTGVLSAAPVANNVMTNNNATIVLLTVASVSLLGLAIALKKKKANR